MLYQCVRLPVGLLADKSDIQANVEAFSKVINFILWRHSHENGNLIINNLEIPAFLLSHSFRRLG